MTSTSARLPVFDREKYLARLKKLRESRNSGDDKLIQFKINKDLRRDFIAKLKKDRLTQKDIFDSAIKIYMGVE